ncbi:hypothetical protein C8R44DRAFT_744334 [Mycena epipterygia]|nr:hypothetical protein C8R44DRAFT_744334 [Mycena epipterygia]
MATDPPIQREPLVTGDVNAAPRAPRLLGGAWFDAGGCAPSLHNVEPVLGAKKSMITHFFFFFFDWWDTLPQVKIKSNASKEAKKAATKSKKESAAAQKQAANEVEMDLRQSRYLMIMVALMGPQYQVYCVVDTQGLEKKNPIRSNTEIHHWHGHEYTYPSIHAWKGRVRVEAWRNRNHPQKLRRASKGSQARISRRMRDFAGSLQGTMGWKMENRLPTYHPPVAMRWKTTALARPWVGENALRTSKTAALARLSPSPAPTSTPNANTC